MLKEDEWPFEYLVANGPDGLANVLETLFYRCQTDEQFAAEEHYILYQLGNQKSLIKTDMSVQPFQFWYYDLLGRPATKIVKETIGRFLWEKGGEKYRSQLDDNQELSHG